MFKPHNVCGAQAMEELRKADAAHVLLPTARASPLDEAPIKTAFS